MGGVRFGKQGAAIARGLCFVALIALMPTGASGRGRDCAARVADAPSQPPLPDSVPIAAILRQLEAMQEFVFVQWNMLNVQYHVGKFKWDPESGEFVKFEDEREKPEKFLKQQGEILQELGTDMLVGEELEGKPALEGFVQRHMKSLWRAFLERGNDPRGIEVGFLLKNDLPIEVEFRSNRHMKWTDPKTDETMPLFSRDLPVMILRARGDARPLLIVVGTHFKSKRNRPGDKQSRRMAKAQADGAITVIEKLVAEFGEDAPIVFSGDTNGDFNHEPEFANLKRRSKLEDVFDVVRPPLSRRDRITHSYHPKDDDDDEEGEPQYSQIDLVAVRPSLRACVKRAEVYRYRNANGKIKPLPRTFEERKQNPSDHYPVRVVFDWQCILELWSRRR